MRVCDDPVGACQSCFQPAAETGTIDRRHHRLAKRLQTIDQGLTAANEAMSVVPGAHLEELIDVGPSNERVKLSRYENDCADVAIGCHPIQHRFEFVPYGSGDLVKRFARQIELEPPNTVLHPQR